MATYTIKDLEQITGIKSPTIRMWEKRYGILLPNRTATNIRYYSEADLKKLINIQVLIQHGLRISQIAQLKSNDFKIQIEKIDQTNSYDLSPFLSALIDLNTNKIENILNKKQQIANSENDFVFNIAYLLYDKTRALWQNNRISDMQKNIVCFIVRKKLYEIINNHPTPKSLHKFICFLPENETDETEILFYIYILRENNLSYNYIGRISSFKDFSSLFHQQDNILCGFSSFICNDYICNFTNQLKVYGASKIYLFHPKTNAEKCSLLPPNTIELISPAQFQSLIKGL